MVVWNSTECSNINQNLNATPLSDQKQYRLNEINEIKDYFVAEIKKRELMSKRLSKYIASFKYFDKSLIVLFVTTGIISIASFATVIGAPGVILNASFSLVILIFTGIAKKLLKTTRYKKKKHNIIVMLARSKWNSIESKIFEALINNEIGREDFMTIINEEKKYRKLKESIRMLNIQWSDVENFKWRIEDWLMMIEESKK